MARSCCPICLNMEGNNLLKNQGFDANLALVSAYDPALGWD